MHPCSICYSLIIIPNLDAYHMFTDEIIWERASHKHCLQVSSTTYSVRAEAQAACLKFGVNCGGVEDLRCDDRKMFSLCISTTLKMSRAGSCVYTPTGASWV